MNFRKSLDTGLLASALALFVSSCSSEDSTPVVPVVPPYPSVSTDTLNPGNVPQDSVPVVPPTDSVTPAPVVVSGVLIDDFEDGDGDSPLGTGWYVYDDAENQGGSVIETPISALGTIAAANEGYESLHSFQVKYSLNKADYAYDPYVGWGVGIPAMDFSALGGISYWYKGGKHVLRIETSDVMNYDYHCINMKASRTWTQVVVRFDDLAQEGWGVPAEFVPANITNVSFQAKGNKVVDSLLIDNLAFVNTTALPPPVADLEVKEAVIPVVEIGDVAVNTALQEKAMKYLNHGVNFTNWLEEATGKFDGTFKFGAADLKIIADNGFKGIRLPIDLDLYATNRDAFATGTDSVLTMDTASLFGVLDSMVTWTGTLGLSLVIDYHEYDNSYNKTSASDTGYVRMMANVWKTVAAHYAASEREDLFYELLNEPDMTNGKVTTAQWTFAAQAMIDSIRTVDSLRTIIFGDAQWYSIDALCRRTPFADQNIIYAIHTYEPFIFTHQGASWTEHATIKNIPFPYDAATWSTFSRDYGVTAGTSSNTKSLIKNYYKTGNKENILQQVNKAKQWAVTNQVPVIINEFGAYNEKSSAQSVLNYYTAMREICDTLQIPWQHWGYTGGFAVIRDGQIIPGLAEALGIVR